VGNGRVGEEEGSAGVWKEGKEREEKGKEEPPKVGLHPMFEILKKYAGHRVSNWSRSSGV